MSLRQNDQDLTPRQLRAIEALLTCASVAAAGELAQVSNAQLHRWLKLPAFRAELDARQDQALRDFARQLQALAGDATAALTEALGRDMPMHVRLRAADLVARHLLAIRSVAVLEARIAALEARLGETS